MNTVHRIHLQQPWQFQATAQRARWSRRFHWPGKLGPDERVWLVCSGFAGGSLGVLLNGQSLGTLPGGEAAAEFDITDSLTLQNELVLERAAPIDSQISGGNGPPGVVCLEIRHRVE
jgi:hypothetical protein